MPTSAQVDEMKKDLAYKQGLLEGSATTVAQLKSQKEYINKDLEKVKSLEFRIDKEMQQAKEKIA